MWQSYQSQSATEISLGNPVKTALQIDAIRSTRATMKKRVQDATAKNNPSDEEGNESNATKSLIVPPEALITLWEYQIISQEWLSKQKPLYGFFEQEGQGLNPSIDETDDTKRQCWLDKGIYRYNQLGSDWILTQLGASTADYEAIIQLYNTAPGKRNAQKMKNMWVVATGWRDADDGGVEDAEFAYLRSSSPNGNGDNMLTAVLHPDRSGVDHEWFVSRTGMVPFGVMDKKVPA